MNWIEKFNFMHTNATLINSGFGELVNQICKTVAAANGHDASRLITTCSFHI